MRQGRSVAGASTPDAACDDCATCTGREELFLGLGRTHEEVRVLAQRCPGCGHRRHRHLHGVMGWDNRQNLADAGITLGVGPPPRDSPLVALMVELGEYDDYFGHLARDGYAPRSGPGPDRASPPGSGPRWRSQPDRD